MSIDKIKVRMENGKTLDVVVLAKRATGIQIVLGEGVHSVKCDLTPTRNGLAYAGSVMGREILYERSVQQVQAEIARAPLKEPILIRSNGYFYNQSDWVQQGYWVWKNLGDQLPFDYEPD